MFVCSVISYLEVSSRDLCRDYIPSLAMNAFVCSTITYLEASSTDFLVASDERVRLQCNNVFGGNPARPSKTSAGTSLRKLSLLNDSC